MNQLLNKSFTDARLLVFKSTPNPEPVSVVLGNITNPAVPLDRIDRGIFLSVSQTLVADPGRPGGLHTRRYEYRLGTGPEKASWQVRWEFEDNPKARYEQDYRYPAAHFHMNAATSLFPNAGEPHFPTRRLWLEEVLSFICSDVLLPRARQRNADDRPVIEAHRRVSEQIAALSARE